MMTDNGGRRLNCKSYIKLLLFVKTKLEKNPFLDLDELVEYVRECKLSRQRYRQKDYGALYCSSDRYYGARYLPAMTAHLRRHYC